MSFPRVRTIGLTASLILLLLSGGQPYAAENEPQFTRPIINHATVAAPISQVWKAWTTGEGLGSFLGRAGEVDLRPRGVFRVVFFPEKVSPLDRGNDGLILAIEPERMLSFTWMTPLHMKDLRGNSTVVTVFFTPIDADTTRVDLVSTGYGQGEAWRTAYDYNVKGWDRILAALEYHFKIGTAIDWDAELAYFKQNGHMSFWRTK